MVVGSFYNFSEQKRQIFACLGVLFVVFHATIVPLPMEESCCTPDALIMLPPVMGGMGDSDFVATRLMWLQMGSFKHLFIQYSGQMEKLSILGFFIADQGGREQGGCSHKRKPAAFYKYPNYAIRALSIYQ